MYFIITLAAILISFSFYARITIALLIESKRESDLVNDWYVLILSIMIPIFITLYCVIMYKYGVGIGLFLVVSSFVILYLTYYTIKRNISLETIAYNLRKDLNIDLTLAISSLALTLCAL